MTGTPCVQVWTLAVDSFDERDAAQWRCILDPTEQARADRFVFGRHRVQYVAAHAMTRWALSELAPRAHPSDWSFVAGPYGKPAAWVGGQPAPLSFSLSHADGMVGVAVAPSADWLLGFDLEALDRNVMLAVADRYFRAEEILWLTSLPEAARHDGFLRLWTLKEAFIKATGEGLSRNLGSFWFTLPPPKIRFLPNSPDSSDDWHFEQRTVAGRFVAAAGLGKASGTTAQMSWTAFTAARWMSVALRWLSGRNSV